MMRDRTAAALIAEAFGTFLFFFVGAGSVVLGDYLAANGGTGPGLLGVALAHGLALAVVVSALGAVSGGHFNPAVTFAVWIMGRITPMRAAFYVVAQLVGGLAAGLALKVAFADAWQASNIGTPALGAGITPAIGIGIEAVLTALLVLAVIGTAVDPRAPKIGGLAIGLAVAADILVGGPLTGAAMNPARWFGPAVAAGTYANWYVWWIGPAIGAAVAAIIYRSTLAEAI
ncbi:MAG: aquaporin [Chloroflexota bacterium]